MLGIDVLGYEPDQKTLFMQGFWKTARHVLITGLKQVQVKRYRYIQV